MDSPEARGNDYANVTNMVKEPKGVDMPRTARAIVGGMYYHVLNRGNNRAPVFHSDTDYAQFVGLISEAQNRIAMDVIAQCLMPNHFHLLVRVPEDESLGKWMQWLLTSHVRQYHKHHRTSGRVWQGRFKAFPVQDDAHLLTVMRYVERNALTANLVERAEAWPWGSLHWRVNGNTKIDLVAPPIKIPEHWVAYVNQPITAHEHERFKTCIHRQQPFGEQGWVKRTAQLLGLESSLNAIGRPRTTA